MRSRVRQLVIIRKAPESGRVMALHSVAALSNEIGSGCMLQVRTEDSITNFECSQALGSESIVILVLEWSVGPQL
jgi:hypothetical protein